MRSVMAGRFSHTWRCRSVGWLPPMAVLGPDCRQAALVDKLEAPSRMDVGSLASWATRLSYALPLGAEKAGMPVSSLGSWQHITAQALCSHQAVLQVFSCDSKLVAVPLQLQEHQQCLYVLCVASGASQLLHLTHDGRPRFVSNAQLRWSSRRGTPILAWCFTRNDCGLSHTYLDNVGCEVLALDHMPDEPSSMRSPLWAPDGSMLSAVLSERYGVGVAAYRAGAWQMEEHEPWRDLNASGYIQTRKVFQAWRPDSQLLLCMPTKKGYCLRATFVHASTRELTQI